MNSKQIFARWKAAIAFVMVLFAAVFMTAASLTQPIAAASSYSFKDIHGEGNFKDTRTLSEIMEDIFKLDTVYMNFDNCKNN